MRSFQNSTPETITKKSEAKGQLHLVGASRDQMMIMYNHFHSIGADGQLLSKSKKRNRMLFNKWFQTLVVQNDRFPMDLPISFVLEEFFNAILQHRVEIKGFNLLTHMRAFHQWLDDNRSAIRAKWVHIQNPEDRPQALPEHATKDQKQQQVSDQERAQMIEKMYGADAVPESLQKFITTEN